MSEYHGHLSVRNIGNDKPLELVIHGVIGDNAGMDSQTVSDCLAAYDGSQINVSINSPGGSAADGIAIYNMLKRHPANVKVIIDGLAASAASVIAMAGDLVEMSDSAMMMIHDPMVNCSGNASEMRNTADTLDKWASAIANSYLNHFNVGLNEIRDMMARETWLTAEETFGYGIVSQLSTSGQPVAALGFVENYKNVPSNLGVIQMGEIKNEVVEEVTEEKEAVETVAEEVTEEIAEVAVEEVTEEIAEELAEELVEEVAKEVAEAAEVRNELKSYMKTFGNADGAEWFANSVSWEDCRQNQVNNLTTQIEELKAALTVAKEENNDLVGRLNAAIKATGETSPVSNMGDDSPGAATGTGMASKINLPS